MVLRLRVEEVAILRHSGVFAALNVQISARAKEQRMSANVAYNITSLAREDAGDLAALEARCFSAPWPEDSYRELLPSAGASLGAASPLTNMVFGIRGTENILFAYVSLGVCFPAQEAEIYNLAVLPAERRRGLGSSLLAFALREMEQCGIVTVFLEVSERNAAARALYEKHGFAQCGLRKGYYTDTGENALVLRRELRRHGEL
jgi:ribosomal-protein-alanine N-acetyltransferase